ncbi:MAG: hypothetical protein QXS20_04855 [Candidatus Thorarchaeota archaeon]
MNKLEDARDRLRIIEDLVCRPPDGYVFVILASQDSRYDLFMLTLLRTALSMGLSTLDVITEPRNRELMNELCSLQSDLFSVMEVTYGQGSLSRYVCAPQLHEVNITLRELRNSYRPRVILFESLTPLIIDFSPRDVVRFFKESVEDSVKSGSREFYLVHQDSADSVTMNQLFSLAHGLVTLTTSKGKYYLDVKKSIGVDLKCDTIEYVPDTSGARRTDWGILLNW